MAETLSCGFLSIELMKMENYRKVMNFNMRKGKEKPLKLNRIIFWTQSIVNDLIFPQLLVYLNK